LDVLARAIRQEKETSYSIWKGRHKIVFADNTLLYVENPIASKNKNPLKLTNKSSNVAGCKINIHFS